MWDALKSPVTMHGIPSAMFAMRLRSSFADCVRARPLKASKCVLNQQNVATPSRGRSFTHVTMRGKIAPHPRLPGFSSARFDDNPASARVLAKLGFEAVGRGMIACAARGHDVEVVTYWLDRQRAMLTSPPLVAAEAPRPRWRAWLGLPAGT